MNYLLEYIKEIDKFLSPTSACELNPYDLENINAGAEMLLKHLHKDSNSDHIITFAGHYHSDGLKNIEKTSNNIFYVPTLSDLQRHENDYPGIYDVNFELTDNGYFKSVNIRLLKYIDKKFKLINEINIPLNHNKKNSNKILTK